MEDVFFEDNCSNDEDARGGTRVDDDDGYKTT
jgi:hypothetical protein